MDEVQADSNSHEATISDPYSQWLGVRTVERPPSPYALLGLPDLEPDPVAITDAAIAVKRQLRGYQIGKYRRQAIELQGEVSRAADTLTHPDKKAEYDARRTEVLVSRAAVNFPQGDLGRPLDDLFLDWLTGCDNAAMPVPQLMPELMDWCLKRSFKWPQRGTLKAPLPLALWVYTDAALVGQLVERGELQMRVRAVKAIQQSLGITENLARMVNQHISRRPRSFTLLPVVDRAAEEPRELMQQWIDRLAEGGVSLDVQSSCYKAMAFLLGLTGQDGNVLETPVEPRVARPRGRSLAGRALRQCRELLERGITRCRMFAADHPDFMSAMKLAGAIALIIFLLMLALMIIAGR